MIIDVSNSSFKNIFSDKGFYLPIRWEGSNFLSTVNLLFDNYIYTLSKNLDFNSESGLVLNTVKSCCGYISRAIGYYLDGFPSRAYEVIEKLMDILVQHPLDIYPDEMKDQFSEDGTDNKLNLFRVSYVDDNKPYKRMRIFHPPYNLRAQVSTSRYSIAGYPSLYLATSLDLCCEEIHLNPYQKLAIASLFRIEKCEEYSNTEVDVIDLAVKPQDFFEEGENVYLTEGHLNRRRIPHRLLNSDDVRARYLLWYPLIAACSFIRTNKSNPFAAEYIIPQFLMQWVRSEIGEVNNRSMDKLIGIRYFSCASIRASEMGFTYVFPTSGKEDSPEYPFCKVLMKAFKLTKPVFLHEFESRISCERFLMRQKDLKSIVED